MLLLYIRTDKPEAEVGLFNDRHRLASTTWYAHRELSVTLHTQINRLLHENEMPLHTVQGIICFKGPGSFTGLRIGLSVANALAYALQIPIVATNGSRWLRQGIVSLLSGHSDYLALPEYGSPVHTTAQRK